MRNEKHCSKCGETKPLDAFGKNKTKGDGRAVACKQCERERLATYRANNPSKVQVSKKKWAEENPEKVRAQQDAWRQKNREKYNAGHRAQQRKNPEKERAKSAAWYVKNAHVKQVQNADRRKTLAPSYVALTLGLPVAETPSDLLAMKREQLLNHRALNELKSTLKGLNHVE